MRRRTDTREDAASAVLKSQNDSKTHQCTEPTEILGVATKTTAKSHPRSDPAWQRLGRKWKQRREAVRVAVQSQKGDAERSLRLANAEAHISVMELLEQKVSERELTRAAAEAAEEMADVEMQQLKNQEAPANEIESHENAHSTALQEIEETEVSWTGLARLYQCVFCKNPL